MINFVLALQAEARPVIDHLKLKKLQTWQPFPIYASDNYRLVISGTGKCNSAAATAWLASLQIRPTSQQNTVWVNIGIAGHKERSLGDAMCCHKITDESTQRSWYPVQIKSPLKSSNILTHDRICTNYSDDSLHDMEASGFYSSALRFTTAELAQCVKIVSDNSNNSIENIDKDTAQRLVNGNLQELIYFSEALKELSLEHLPIDTQSLMQSITGKWKFTVTQQRQLERLLQRHAVVDGDSDQLLRMIDSQQITAASQALHSITEELNQRAVEIE